MVIEFRIATQEDIDYVRANPYEDAVKNYPKTEVPTTNAFVAIDKGKVLGVFGLQIRWQGLGMFWLICRREFIRLGTRTIITTVRDTVDFMIKENNLYRAEMYIRTDFAKAARMANFLGFEKEGIMKHFFPDKSNAFLYGKAV